MNLPNRLTIWRIFLTVIFIIALFNQGLLAKICALIVFSIASLTDLCDGYLARKYNMITDFGKFMDPIADKILVLSAFFAFIEMGLVPAWMVVIIVLRELIVTGIRSLALMKRIVLPAEGGGKNKTVSQMVAVFTILIFLVLRETGEKLPSLWGSHVENHFKNAIFVLMLIATAFTIASGGGFLYKNRALFKG